MSQMCSSGFKSCVYKGYIIRDLARAKKRWKMCSYEAWKANSRDFVEQ